MGVATRAETHVDLQCAFTSADQALHSARQVQQVLNIELYREDAPDSGVNFKRTALIWLGLCLLAVLLGAVWELKSGTL